MARTHATTTYCFVKYNDTKDNFQGWARYQIIEIRKKTRKNFKQFYYGLWSTNLAKDVLSTHYFRVSRVEQPTHAQDQLIALNHYELWLVVQTLHQKNKNVQFHTKVLLNHAVWADQTHEYQQL